MSQVCFFVVGDIGHTGHNRSSVATAMQRLDAESELKCSFVVTTGDNVYGQVPSESTLAELAADMMHKLPVPWFFTAGNHDVKAEKLAWHMRCNGATGTTGGSSGWSFCFPCPAYSISEQRPELTRDVLDAVVISTNKLQSGWPRGGAPPALSPGFYDANDRLWWKQQKQSLTNKLQCSCAAWRIVFGHHPAEFVKFSLTEHKLPVTRYFLTTFMRGGAESRRHRQALNHILRRDADVYICGHQHLMAHMKLAALNSSRPQNETRCDFLVLGNSSRLDQDSEYSESDECESGASATHESDTDRTERNARYSEEWVQQGRLGFLRVIADAACLRAEFYAVDGDSQACKLVHAMNKHK
jgi:hypothetical protein